ARPSRGPEEVEVRTAIELLGAPRREMVPPEVAPIPLSQEHRDRGDVDEPDRRERGDPDRPLPSRRSDEPAEPYIQVMQQERQERERVSEVAVRIEEEHAEVEEHPELGGSASGDEQRDERRDDRGDRDREPEEDDEVERRQDIVQLVAQEQEIAD